MNKSKLVYVALMMLCFVPFKSVLAQTNENFSDPLTTGTDAGFLGIANF